MSAADAERDDTFSKLISAHRMQEPRGQDSAGRPDRVTMGNGATLDIDDVLGKLKLLGDGERHSGESLVDFDTIDVADFPTRALESRLDRRHGTQPE